MPTQLLQIAPAQPGWRALHVARTDEGSVELIVNQVCVWGLVEETSGDESFRFVEGYDVQDIVARSTESGGFVRYLEPGEDPEDFREEAEAYLVRREKREEEKRLLWEAGFRPTSKGSGQGRFVHPTTGELLDKRTAVKQARRLCAG